MLGYQARAPAEQQSGFQQQQQQQDTSATATTTTLEQVNNKREEKQSSPLTSHINLINQAKQADHRQQQLASPGYHSGNSSPSSSAVNSPVSTSSSMNSASSPTSNGPPSSSPLSSSSSSSGISMANTSNSTSANSSSSSPASSRSPISPNLLDYYPELNQDGLGLSWFHDANNRARLTAALMSNRMLISGDISLAEMSRYPVPIMARPPLGVSDITLENWLQEVVHAQPQRGIKLTFTSTRTVEPAFRVLSRHAELIKGPLILSADILASGHGAGQSARGQAANKQQLQQSANGANQPVDAWTFLMLCRTRFPRCIISIGWCAAAAAAAAASPSQPEGNTIHLSSTDPMFELDVGPLDAVALNRQQAAHMFTPLRGGTKQQSNNGNGGRTSNLMMNHQQLSQHLSQHHHNQLTSHHQILSSTGSLNSSSGNSSGSPSPTSPVGHLLMSPPTYYNNGRSHHLSQQNHHQHHHHHSHQQQQHHHQKSPSSIDSSEAASSATTAAAAAAAAAMAAAVMAASASQFQQVPLNLNINEADQQLSSSSSSTSSSSSSTSSLTTSSAHTNHTSSSLNQLAKKIQSYQSLNSLANSSHHIHKKAAIGTTNPSPQSTNFNNNNRHRQQHQHQHQHQQQQQQQQQQQHANMLLKTTSATTNFTMAGGYTREMIDRMASLVKEYNLTQPVTFPVEAKLIRGSLAELQRLLYQVGSNSTLTIVAQQDDLINVDDLLRIRKGFATNQLLFDLPSDLAEAFRQELVLLNDD